MRHLKASSIASARLRLHLERNAHTRRSRYLIPGAALTAVAWLSIPAVPATAQISLYESEDASIDVGLDAATAAFAQNNSWFGEPEANIGVDSNSWTEFAIEPQLYLTWSAPLRWSTGFVSPAVST